MTLEEAYIDHILLHLHSSDPDDRPLRTYLDSWYAHHIGTEMMEQRISRPQWLNRGDLQRRPELAGHCHAISEEAEACIGRNEVSQLAKDHSVPIAQLTAEFKSRGWPNREELRTFLLRRYRVAVLTRDEHRKVRRGDLARRRAHRQFGPDDCVFARYGCPEYGIRYRILKA